MKLANMNSGKSLRILMEQKDLTREKLADELGVSLATMSGLRNSKIISGSNLAMLSHYFKITASDFLRLGEE